MILKFKYSVNVLYYFLLASSTIIRLSFEGRFPKEFQKTNRPNTHLREDIHDQMENWIWKTAMNKILEDDKSIEESFIDIDRTFLKLFMLSKKSVQTKEKIPNKEKRLDHEDEDLIWLYRLLRNIRTLGKNPDDKPGYQKTFAHETKHQAFFHNYFPSFAKHIYDCLDKHGMKKKRETKRGLFDFEIPDFEVDDNVEDERV